MSSELKGQPRWDFWVLTVAQFSMYCGYFSFFQFPVFIKAVGGNETAIGVMGGLGAFASTLFIPWIADFVNRSERKRLMHAGVALTTVSTLGSLTLGAPDTWMATLLICRGLGFALYNNAAGAYVADILPPSERSRWFGINFGVNQIAVAVGPGLAEVFITHLGFSAFFLMAAGFEIFAIILLSWISRRQPRGEQVRLGVVHVGRVFFSTLGRRDLRYLYLTLLLMACGLGAIVNFTATYLKGIALSSGVFFTVYALINGGSRMVGGGLSDRFGRAVVIIPMLSIFSLGLFIYSVTDGVTLMVASALLTGLGFGMANPTLLTQLLDCCDAREQGRVIGGFHFAYQVGALCATPLHGIIADTFGYAAMWRVAGCMVLGSTLVYALAVGRREIAGRRDAVPEESS